MFDEKIENYQRSGQKCSTIRMIIRDILRGPVRCVNDVELGLLWYGWIRPDVIQKVFGDIYYNYSDLLLGNVKIEGIGDGRIDDRRNWKNYLLEFEIGSNAVFEEFVDLLKDISTNGFADGKWRGILEAMLVMQEQKTEAVKVAITFLGRKDGDDQIRITGIGEYDA